MFKMLFGISTVILHQRIKAVINGFLYLHLWHSKSQPSVAYKSVAYKKRACIGKPDTKYVETRKENMLSVFLFASYGNTL